MRPPPKFIRVFLVEDSHPDALLVTEMLRQCGGGQFILCGIFVTLAEALAGLKTSGTVDVVLLDLSLPDSKGIDTFQGLSKVAPEQPVVILSGYDDEQLAMEMVHQGAQDYLIKYELTGKMLVRSINYAIERKRAELALKAIRADLEKRVEERTHRLSAALDQLRAAQDRLIQQERVHAMERMAGGIAHDFNNALSPILAHSEWLLRKPGALDDKPGLKKALSHIYESARHCAAVVVRLREFSHQREVRDSMELLDICEVMRRAVFLTQPSWKDQMQMRGGSITMETDFEGEPKIFGVKEEVVEMFADLILNSVDAISGKGVITLRVAIEGQRVLASIIDTGAGMSTEVSAQCMEPFFTTKKGRGSGLGLSVVHGIAQRHNAEISIESQEGKGTRVTVNFPLAPADASAAVEPQTESRPRKAVKKLRILVAEDDPNIREILSIYLADDGHTVEMAADGNEALAHFSRGQHDLLLTDYSMPNMNGDHLAAAVRAVDPDIRVALLTGFGSQLPQGALLRLEVDTIISKPFTFESLRQGIAEAMGS